MNEVGEPSRMIGVNIDVTQSKQAEEALADMTRKFIDAQEQERSRIGRELHDDVEELRKEVTDISNDVQALSHDLHSSKLEYLGAIAGMKSWCKEFAERQKMEIDFKSDVVGVLPLNVGHSLFRVLQEALHKCQQTQWREARPSTTAGRVRRGSSHR